MSPFGLASAGIAITRISGMPGGSLGGVSCDDSPATADAMIPSNFACEHLRQGWPTRCLLGIASPYITLSRRVFGLTDRR
jgi:hypothetical protein